VNNIKHSVCKISQDYLLRQVHIYEENAYFQIQIFYKQNSNILVQCSAVMDDEMGRVSSIYGGEEECM
jgi:hypothetical protein